MIQVVNALVNFIDVNLTDFFIQESSVINLIVLQNLDFFEKIKVKNL